MSNEAVYQRLNELSQLAGALQPFSVIAKELQAWLDKDLESLIAFNNEETRGRVKLLKRLLDWPTEVQQEIHRLQQELP